LHAVVDYVNPTCTCSRQDKTGKRVSQCRSPRRERAIDWIKQKRRRNKEKIAGAHVNREGTAVKTSFKRLNFQCDPIVVNAVTAMNTQLFVIGRVIKTNAWRPVVDVFAASAVKEREDDRIQL